MKFTILTYGTDGDTRPLAALARGLMRRGHDAQLLADRSAAPLAREHGIPFIPLAGDILQAVRPGGALDGAVSGRAGMPEVTRACARIARDNTAAWMATAAEAAQGSDALVFSGMASYVGLAVAEALDLPCIGAGMWPMTPTREFGAAFFKPRKLPGWANRLTHQAFAGLSWAMFRPAVNAARREVCDLSPRRRMWEGYPILYGCSPSLVPPPADWPAEVSMTGAWQLPAREGWRPPARLAAFLDEGEPPVYVGFGSMAGMDRHALVDALHLLAATRRVLFYPGWSGVDLTRLPGNVHVLGDTPHEWLLPRVSLAIHHGGAGTSHAAARAGVPSVVVPFAGDQFFWAARIEQAGVGVHCPMQRFRGVELEDIVARACAPSMRQLARRLSQAMMGEHGVDAAVDRLIGGAARRLGRPLSEEGVFAT